MAVTNAFSGKTVFISGGTSGIALGTARMFASRGANVLIFGRNGQKATEAAAAIRTDHGLVVSGAADVRRPEEIQTLFSETIPRIGLPDIVIAAAAGNFVQPASDLSPNGFKAVVDIDLLGTFNLFRAAYDIVRRPGASLIAISAPQSKQTMKLQAHVCAAKAGVNMLVQCLALEWGPIGIRVNGISPGPIEGTEGVSRMAATDEDKARWKERTPLRRFGTLDDISEAVSFLAGPLSSYITGTILDCDGGMQLGNASATLPPP